MNLAEIPTAWDHSPTRRAWSLHMSLNVAGLIGWVGGWIALLGISTETPNWVVWIFMPYFIYGFYRAYVQLRYFPAALRMRRIMRAYPWQVLRDVPHGLADLPEIVGPQHGWFEFPSPADPGQRIPLVFTQHFRLNWWTRRMAPRAKPHLKAQIESIWFAGDPRMIGLIAAPTPSGQAPRRFQILDQRLGKGDGDRLAEWGLTPDDLERGRRVGVTPNR
ncbi:hypothetical protein [Streptomyces huasconensis]|uniref:hypothetical protein n=1 Tax=Streptomyces huasconensis TaxID=1854574 RepID=UPI0036F89FB9